MIHRWVIILILCVCNEPKRNAKYQGAFQVIRESTVSGNVFQSYYVRVCVCVHWIEIPNVFLTVAHGQKNAFISVSPSMDLGPAVPDAPRVCSTTFTPTPQGHLCPRPTESKSWGVELFQPCRQVPWRFLMKMKNLLQGKI